MERGSVREIFRAKGSAAYAEPPVTEEEKRTFDASANVVTAVTKKFIRKGSNLNDEIK